MGRLGQITTLAAPTAGTNSGHPPSFNPTPDRQRHRGGEGECEPAEKSNALHFRQLDYLSILKTKSC